MIQDFLHLLIKLLYDQVRGPLYLHHFCVRVLMIWLQKIDMEDWVKLESLRQFQHIGHLPYPLYHFKQFIIFWN